MKVDKAIQERLVKNLTNWLDSLCDSMKHWINKIKEAETVEEIMMYKKAMLVDYVNSMPMRSDECYFCLLYVDVDCGDVPPCEYGVVHGVCSNKDSDYESIRKLRDKLKNEILNRYYRCEKYDNIGEGEEGNKRTRN